MRQYFIDAAITIVLLISGLALYDQFYLKPTIEQIKLSLKPEQEIEVQVVTNEQKAQTLADVMWCENRSSKKSMDLVLSVIHTRAKQKTLDGLYKEAIKSKQFSCLNSPDIMQAQTRKPKDEEMMQYAQFLVARFIAGNYKPIIKAKFYYAADKIDKPKYLEDKQLVLAFEGHHFYN